VNREKQGAATHTPADTLEASWY